MSAQETPDGNGELAIDYDAIADDLTPEQAETLADNLMIETPEGEVPLTAVMVDILVAHGELDDYREAGLRMTQQLKERRMEAERNDNAEAVALLQELEESAYGIYLRLRRGDAELTGDRDGEYSDYFENDGTA